jgi:hypothetical protein
MGGGVVAPRFGVVVQPGRRRTRKTAPVARRLLFVGVVCVIDAPLYLSL